MSRAANAGNARQDGVESESAAICGEWLYDAARVSQTILCDIRARAYDPRRAVDAIDALPTPGTRLEQLVLQGLLFDVLLGCVQRPPGSTRTECLRSVVQQFLSASARPSALMDSPERRAIAMIRQNFAQPLDVGAIARSVGCNQTTLRRLVRSEVGMSMRQLHIRYRVAHALRMFAAGERKITAVARLVGYRSDKNLYRVLREVTGMTPSQIRSMTSEPLHTLAGSVFRTDERNRLQRKRTAQCRVSAHLAPRHEIGAGPSQ